MNNYLTDADKLEEQEKELYEFGDPETMGVTKDPFKIAVQALIKIEKEVNCIARVIANSALDEIKRCR